MKPNIQPALLLTGIRGTTFRKLGKNAKITTRINNLKPGGGQHSPPIKNKTMNFQETELAKKIIERCVCANACKPEFKRLIASETEIDFLSVLTDNWLWSSENKVLDFETVCEFSEDSRKEKNVSAYNVGDHSCNVGYCILSGSATVRAYGSATVEASPT